MLLVSANNMTAFGVQLSFGVRNVNFYQGCDGLQATIFSILDLDTGFDEQIGETEVIYQRATFNFEQKCEVNFRFEKLQRYRVKFQAFNSSINTAVGHYGMIEFDLSLVFANGGILSLPIANTFQQFPQTTCEISAKIPEYYSQHLRLQFGGCHIHPVHELTEAFYYVLSIPIGHRNIMLHKSELIRDTKNPDWPPFSIPLFVLNFYNESSIQIHCYNHVGNHNDQVIGYCSTTLTQLQRGVGSFNSYMLLSPNGQRIDEKTSIELRKLELEGGPSFFEMLKNGSKVHLTEAFDFTASNGNFNSETSLHFIHPHRKTPYVNTILEITPPLMGFLPNSHAPTIGALGFGANIASADGRSSHLSHCFFMNGSSTNHMVNGLLDLLTCYQTTIMTVQPFAPTDFSEVIYYISKFAKAESRRNIGLYFVLIIMSDGGPANATAMKRTIDALVDASPHPMSVIAVGVGNDRDFTSMRNLESLTLKHSDNRLLVRQNYTFVEASELSSSDALSMIPLQMIQWKQHHL